MKRKVAALLLQLPILILASYATFIQEIADFAMGAPGFWQSWAGFVRVFLNGLPTILIAVATVILVMKRRRSRILGATMFAVIAVEYLPLVVKNRLAEEEAAPLFAACMALALISWWLGYSVPKVSSPNGETTEAADPAAGDGLRSKPHQPTGAARL